MPGIEPVTPSRKWVTDGTLRELPLFRCLGDTVFGAARQHAHMNTITFDTLPQFVGQLLGTSAWIEMPQNRIDAFADCSEDRQWIHIDVERSLKESPFGATVAHGFLTLSLLPITIYEVLEPLKARKSVAYGLDKVRFIAPVRAGSRVRNHIRLLSAEPRNDGFWLLRLEHTVEIEGESKPALVAVTLGLLSPT